jgi:hypothetical protein
MKEINMSEVSNSRAGFLDMVCSLYISKDANGFYSMSEEWDRSEAKSWNVDYIHATNKIKTLLRSMNISQAKIGR